MLHVLNPPINKDETEEHTTSQQKERPHFNTKVLKFIGSSLPCQVMQWDRWMRHYNTRQKVVGLIPRGSLRFFFDIILQVTLWLWGQLSL
jgi:hypothetical protein